MHAIFDHIYAVLIGATMLVALLFVQFRQQQNAAATVLRHQAAQQASTFSETAEREVENIRSRDHAVYGAGYYVSEVTGTSDRTDRFSFVTLVADSLGGTQRIVGVSYRLVPTGETVRVGAADRPTYRVERWENRSPAAVVGPDAYTLSGVIAENVTSFRVRALNSSGTPVAWAGTAAGWGRSGSEWGTSASNDPVQYSIEIEGATALPAQVASDQASTSSANLVRKAFTVRPVSRGASGTPPPSIPWVAPRPIPMGPGEGPRPIKPVAPPSTPSTPPSSPSTPSIPSTPSPAPPAPAPLPPPPPGVEI